MHRLVALLTLLLSVQLAAAQSRTCYRQVVAAAASVEGAEGSYWRTDLTFFNPSSQAAWITLELVPSGLAGAGAEGPTVTLPSAIASNQVLRIADVLGTHFAEHATGALVISGHDGDGAEVGVVVSSRTWTPAADGLGTLGQGIPGIEWPEDGALAERERVLVGLEASDAFRSNLGLVNLSRSQSATFTVEILDPAGASLGSLTYTLGPLAHLQRNNVLAELGLEGAGLAAVVRLTDPPESGAAALDYVAYASKIDRTSNDPFYIQPQPTVTAIGPARDRIVPVVASVPGEEGSYWRSDLAIHNPTDGNVFLWINLIPTGVAGAADDPPRSSILMLNAHATLLVEDVLAQRFPDYQAGALTLTTKDLTGQTVSLQVSSRTWTPAGDGQGTLGQGIPGLAMDSDSGAVVIPDLESSEGFRSNLGLVNPSLNLRETFAVEILDGTGASRGTLTYVLEPWAHLQVNGILDQLSLVGSGYTAVVSLAATENLFVNESESWDPAFFAYGSRIDCATNDPIFLTAFRREPHSESGDGDWYAFEDQAPWYQCPEAEFPEEATVVTAFDRADHYFGAEDHRVIVEEVEFPSQSEWNQVGLYLQLECPSSGLCDHWDRTGSLELVLNPEAPSEEWEYLEIMRHITPYRIGMCEYVDVTALASLLTGTRTLASFIDTWVGPGHSDGDGWRITFRFVFYPGEPRQADQVLNVWGRRSITLGYLDPEHNLDSQIDPVPVLIPADATRVEARLTTTGHAFGNSDNCAEFCPLWQDLVVGDQVRSILPWRTDCEYNPVGPQQGTFQYDRNGWCPGAIVVGHTIDITDLVVPGEEALIDFNVRTFPEGEEYHNTIPADYDPYEWISLHLFVYTE